MLPCTRLSHLWLLRGIFSMNGNMSSAILRELQVGDLSTSTAMDNIRWSRSIALGERNNQHRETAPQLAKQSLGDGP